MRCISCILQLLNYKTSFGHSSTFAQARVKLARYLLLCVTIICKYACHITGVFYAFYSSRNYNFIANIKWLFIIVLFCLSILNIYHRSLIFICFDSYDIGGRSLSSPMQEYTVTMQLVVLNHIQQFLLKTRNSWHYILISILHGLKLNELAFYNTVFFPVFNTVIEGRSAV